MTRTWQSLRPSSLESSWEERPSSPFVQRRLQRHGQRHPTQNDISRRYKYEKWGGKRSKIQYESGVEIKENEGM